MQGIHCVRATLFPGIPEPDWYRHRTAATRPGASCAPFPGEALSSPGTGQGPSDRRTPRTDLARTLSLVTRPMASGGAADPFRPSGEAPLSPRVLSGREGPHRANGTDPPRAGLLRRPAPRPPASGSRTPRPRHHAPPGPGRPRSGSKYLGRSGAFIALEGIQCPPGVHLGSKNMDSLLWRNPRTIAWGFRCQVCQ